MVVIEEEKLYEMVSRAFKEELQLLLSNTLEELKRSDIAAKSVRVVTPPEWEHKPQKKDAMPPEMEQTLNIRQAAPPVESRYLHSLKELAVFLGCSIPTALRYKKDGRFPFIQIGRTLKFDTLEILKALNRESRKS